MSQALSPIVNPKYRTDLIVSSEFGKWVSCNSSPVIPPVNLDGKQLPNAPENTIHLGVAYTFNLAMGDLTARWDYYWQDDSYAREFNSRGDTIDSWDQHNASLELRSKDDRWIVRAWVRNIQDEDNVTGKYLTADTSGFYRNYFLTDPRIYGASVRYTFGEIN